ncbi:MAG: hypothetical protein ACK5Q5_19235 [Planctomycetaceae bacterium]
MRLIGRLLLGIALLGTVGSTLRAYPHQLAYFNEASGGPYDGWRHLLGSNFNWGQDFYLVARRSANGGFVIVSRRAAYQPRMLGLGFGSESSQISIPETSSVLLSLDILQSQNPREVVWTRDGYTNVGDVLRATAQHRHAESVSATTTLMVVSSPAFDLVAIGGRGLVTLARHVDPTFAKRSGATPACERSATRAKIEPCPGTTNQDAVLSPLAPADWETSP